MTSLVQVTFLGKPWGENAVTNLRGAAVWGFLMRWALCGGAAACAEVEMLSWTGLCSTCNGCVGQLLGSWWLCWIDQGCAALAMVVLGSFCVPDGSAAQLFSLGACVETCRTQMELGISSVEKGWAQCSVAWAKEHIVSFWKGLWTSGHLWKWKEKWQLYSN